MSHATPTIDDLGVEPIGGSPDDLRAAATAWKGVARALQHDANTLTQACTLALALDWSGQAAQQYSCYSSAVTQTCARAGAACRGAGDACEAFAADLERAQEREASAIWQAFDGLRRKRRAEDDMAAAAQQIGVAETDRAAAQARGNAAAGRPDGAGQAADAALDAQRAQSNLAAARDAYQTAAAAWKQGIEDHTEGMRAIKREQHAAKAAAETARTRLALALEIAREPVPKTAQLPVPVTVRPWGAVGAIFGAMTVGVTPSERRQAQIAYATQHPGEAPLFLKTLQAAKKGVSEITGTGRKAAQGAFAIDLRDSLKGTNSKLPGFGRDLKRYSTFINDIKPLTKVAKILGPFTSAVEGIIQHRPGWQIPLKVVVDFIPFTDFDGWVPPPKPTVDTTPPGQCT